MDIRKLQRAIVDGLEDVKAQNIVVFNTEALSPLFERVIIASGTSNRQTKALASSVRDAVKAIGEPVPRIEGEENGEWIIVDCGAAVAHIMQPAIRDYYHLEEIWGVKPVQLKSAVAKAKSGLPKAETPAKPARKTAAKTATKTAAKTAARPASKTATKAPAKPAKAAPRVAVKAPAKAPAKTVAPTTAAKVAAKTAAKVAAKPAAKLPSKAPAKTAVKATAKTAAKTATKTATKTAARKTGASAGTAAAAKPATRRVSSATAKRTPS